MLQQIKMNSDSSRTKQLFQIYTEIPYAKYFAILLQEGMLFKPTTF